MSRNVKYYLISDKEIKGLYPAVKLIVGQSAACEIFGVIYSRKISGLKQGLSIDRSVLSSMLVVEQKTSDNTERNKMLYNKKWYLDVRLWGGIIVGQLIVWSIIAVIARFVHF